MCTMTNTRLPDHPPALLQTTAVLVTLCTASLAFSLTSLAPPNLVLGQEVSADHPARVKRGLEIFRTHVRNLLLNHCAECHGIKRTEGGLNLLTRDGLMAGGDSGPAVTLQQPDLSLLFKMVTHEAEPFMPLDRAQLSAQDISLLHTWIENEAPYDKPLVKDAVIPSKERVITEKDRQFWSLQKLSQSPPPAVKDRLWSTNAADCFVLARIEQDNIVPVAPAPPNQLVRRANLDLLGLPPSPEMIDTFERDQTPDAWEKSVDRWLASPHFGERWARHWLDVARFAESYGFEHDLDNNHAYHYRDFVIHALNSNLPFDDFVRWQIAGDEIAPDNAFARMATGFLAAGVHNANIAKVGVEPERYNELDDLAATVGNAMLGLSIGCARCHDHKFDPIRQQDYYRFIATFERTIRGELELAIPTANGTKQKVLVAGEGLTPLDRVYDPPPAFYEETWFLRRGDTRLKTHKVSPGFPEVLLSNGSVSEDWNQEVENHNQGTTRRRAALAAWITDVEQGSGALLARVIANRLWQHHFGQGIVATPNDFGQRGERPTHPDLLEWLAAELICSDWDMKHLHRIMLQSSTWRQATLTLGATEQNQRLFRGHQLRRLEAETIRDSMLALSNSFDRRMYGAGTLVEQQPRRSIYFRVKRSKMIPMMSLFDAPDALQSLGRRPHTTVSPQALALLNAQYIRQLAAEFAERLITDGQPLPQVITQAYRETLGRSPTTDEIMATQEFLSVQLQEYGTLQQREIHPPTTAGMAFWLDATSLPSDTSSLPQWTSATNTRTFQAFTDQVPQYESHATPSKQAAVRFGPQPTILRRDNDPALNFGTSDFSISLLFRLDPSASDDNQLIGKDSFSGADSYSGFFLQHFSGQIRFATRNQTPEKSTHNYLDSTPFVRKGIWHRVTAVRQDGILSLYIEDGHAPNGTRHEVTPTNVDNNVGLKIGNMDESLSGALHGHIAEVMVYSRALSPTEVRDCHKYLWNKYLFDKSATPQKHVLTDFCQALFCLNEFIYPQ